MKPPRLRLLFRPSLIAVMPAVLFVGTLIAVLWRMFTHVLHISIDDWAYTVWGQAIASGRRPSLEYLLTAPKPLAYVLAAIVSPFPAGYGIAVAIAIFGAALVAVIAVAVRKEAGVLGVPVALGLLAWTDGFRYNTERGSVDIVSAALVVSAMAVRGRWRVVLLAGAGLLRPEVWPVVALAAFFEAEGHLVRRLAIGGLSGLIAPTLWALADIAANGRPFMFIVVGNRGGTFKVSTHGLRNVPAQFYAALSGSGHYRGGVGQAVVVLGVTGLILHAVRTYRAGTFDPLPITATALLTVGIAAELSQGLPPYPRYTTSVATLLLVGTGWLAGALRPQTEGWLPGLVATVMSILMIGAAVMFYPISYGYRRADHMERALPAIKQARRCGKILVTGGNGNHIMVTLAALGRMPLTTFSPYAGGTWPASGAVLRAKPEIPGRSLPPNPRWSRRRGDTWVKVGTTVGQLWLTEECVQKGGLVSHAEPVVTGGG
jgi:hypothetical protein